MLEWLTRNWSLKLLALVIAVAMWIFVVGQEKSELSLRVPVEITNIPPDTLLVGDVIDDVEVRLYGPRSLIRRVATERMTKAVDLTGMGVGEHVFQINADSLKLPPGLRVLRISPATFTVTLAARAVRQVQVRPVLKGQPAPGKEVAEVVFRPEKVEAYGREQDLRDLDWIWTEPIDLTGRKDNFSLTAQLRLPGGRNIRLARTTVEAQVKLQASPTTTKPPGHSSAGSENSSTTP